MKIKISNIDFDCMKGRLVICMRSESMIQDKIKLCFIERRMGAGNKLFKPKKRFYSLIINQDEISSEIQLNEYMDLFSCSDIWDAYIYNETNKKYYRVIVEKSLDFNYYNDNYYMKRIKPYRTADNCLSLFSKSMYTTIKCEKVVTNTDSIEIYIDNTIIEKQLEECYIRLKRRVHRFLNYFDENIDLKLDGNKVIIFSEIFYKQNISLGDVYECTVVIFKGKEYEYEVPIAARDIQGNYVKNTEYTKYKAFANSKNVLSLFFTNNRKITVDNIVNDNKKLTLNLLGQIYGEIDKLKLITYKNNTYLKHGYYIENFEYLKDENKINIDFEELSKMIKRWGNQKFILNCIISNHLSNDKVKEVEEVNLQFNHQIGEQIIDNENYEIKLIKGGSNECVFILNERKVRNKVKLAILGSCYSRAAFASSNYFNPGYKEKYDIVLTHFHSSLISVMGDKKKKFEERYFEGLKPINKEYLRADFEKTFFESLKNSEAEYLIIDIYADAQKGIIIFPDGSIITGNVDVEISQLMFELEDDTQTISPKDINAYLPLWIDAAQRFSREIVKYIDEKNIIINYTRAIETYVDTKNNKKVYDTQIDYIRLSNLITDWMNDYLSYLLPDAQIIDSRKLNYVGFEKHPLGNTPNHYESGYYKEFMELIDNIILKNR